MTSEMPPDPDPAKGEVPGLEKGGGVRPGDTPPAAGETSGVSEPQPMHSRAGAVTTIVVIIVIALAIALLLAARVFDLL